jgi:hypothetical protein
MVRRGGPRGKAHGWDHGSPRRALALSGTGVRAAAHPVPRTTIGMGGPCDRSSGCGRGGVVAASALRLTDVVCLNGKMQRLRHYGHFYSQAGDGRGNLDRAFLWPSRTPPSDAPRPGAYRSASSTGSNFERSAETSLGLLRCGRVAEQQELAFKPVKLPGEESMHIRSCQPLGNHLKPFLHEAMIVYRLDPE